MNKFFNYLMGGVYTSAQLDTQLASDFNKSQFAGVFGNPFYRRQMLFSPLAYDVIMNSWEARSLSVNSCAYFSLYNSAANQGEDYQYNFAAEARITLNADSALGAASSCGMGDMPRARMFWLRNSSTEMGTLSFSTKTSALHAAVNFESSSSYSPKGLQLQHTGFWVRTADSGLRQLNFATGTTQQTSTQSLNNSRDYATLEQAQSQGFVFCDYSSNADIYVWDLNTLVNAVTSTAMSVTTDRPGCAGDHDYKYLLGGFYSGSQGDKIEKYNVSADTISTIADTLTTNTGYAVAHCDGPNVHNFNTGGVNKVVIATDTESLVLDGVWSIHSSYPVDSAAGTCAGY